MLQTVVLDSSRVTKPGNIWHAGSIQYMGMVIIMKTRPSLSTVSGESGLMDPGEKAAAASSDRSRIPEMFHS